MSLDQTLVSLCMAVVLAACSRYSYEDESFQSTRQERSVLSLARFVSEKPDSSHADKASSLIDKHYEHALKGLAARDEAGFTLALLNHLRKVRDPRINVRVSRPSLPPDGDAEQMAYFSIDQGYAAYFASGASKVATAAFPYQIVVFEFPGYNFEPEEGDVSVEVSWAIRPGDSYFGLPSILGTMEEESVQGIAADIKLRFLIPGQPEPYEFSSSVSPTTISYESFLGMATRDDLYSGMSAMAFEMAMNKVWSQAPEGGD